MNNEATTEISIAEDMRSAISDEAKKAMKKNNKSYNKFSYFIQGIDVTQKNLDSMTPYVKGYTRLFMHTPPKFMQTVFPAETKSFKSYIETGYKTIDGIGDITTDEITISGGWAGQSFSNISGSKDDTTEISITLYEQTGSPVRAYIESWISGMRDPRSGVAHYHGALDLEENSVEYGEKNHTCEFIYVDLDPTARYIEYACMFAHCWPTRISKSHLNYDSGDRGEVTISIPFSCTKYEGRYVNELAYYYISQQKLNYNYLNFSIFEDRKLPDKGNTNYTLELEEDETYNNRAGESK